MMIAALEHLTMDGDRWDALAWRYYGDATAFEGIIMANPFVAITPTLASGITLLIPILPAVANALNPQDVPPWKR